MNVASMLYLPPPSCGYPQKVLENLAKFPPRHRLILFSDHDWPGVVKIANPNVAKSIVNPDGQPKSYAVSNIVFYTALRIAISQGITHIFYLEADCRVGREGWDEVVWNEYFSHPFPAIAAGSLVCYAPFNESKEAARKFSDFYQRSKAKRPIPIYGCKGASERHPVSVFPNGALSVVRVDVMEKMFDLTNTWELTKASAWDMEIGFRLWREFGPDSYDVVQHLNTSWSSYGDVQSTEAERIEMLRKGEFVAVHQIKSDANP